MGFTGLSARFIQRRLLSKLGNHLCKQKCYFSSEGDRTLLKYLVSKIKATGPLTIAEYMKEVLTNPISGYYMTRDVFGTHGDFITSPEISQMFGELIGIWCVNEWIQAGSKGPLKVVELGPGRGTLADDMCRIFSQFSQLKDKVSLHLVEVSPALSQIQANKLTGTTEPSGTKLEPSIGDFYHHVVSKYNQNVYWYHNLRDVPNEHMYYIAHELFDALPIHKFQKTDKGWREVMIDADDSKTDDELRFVVAPKKTVALSYLEPFMNDNRDHIEMCPEGGAMVQELAHRIKSYGGSVLIGDYGHAGDKTDTFRGFKKHQIHDVLKEPGSADLTADVDFSYLSYMAKSIDEVKVHGPRTQSSFLMNMGIGIRLQVLLQNAKTNEWKDMLTGYDMLVNPQKMGERFKFLSLTAGQQEDYIPAGFENVPETSTETPQKTNA